MTFADIPSITVPAGVSLQAPQQPVSSHAAHMAQMVGSMSWIAAHASRWGHIAPADLCAAAITIALVGPVDLGQVMTVIRGWPRERGPGEFRWQPSFGDPVYAYIEDIGASFSIAVNGGGSTPDAVARNFALGVAKSALWAIVQPTEEDTGFETARPGFNNVPLPPRLLEQLLPDAEARALIGSIDAMLASGQTVGPVAAAIPACVDPTPGDRDTSGVAETTSIAELVDAMQRGPFRVTQKPHLVASTIRIWLHTLGLIDADTVGDLRAALAAWPADREVQHAVIGRSLRYGLFNRAPPEFKARDTCPARCDEIILGHPLRFAPLSITQELERGQRWSHWVRYLDSEHFAGGPLPHVEWRHPD